MKTPHAVLVVSSRMKFYTSLVPLLQNVFGEEIFFAADTVSARKTLMTNDISAIIINTPLTDDFGIDFAIKCASEKNYGVLMFTGKEFFEIAQKKVSPFGVLTVEKPNSPETVSQAVILLHSASCKLCAVKNSTVTDTEAQNIKTLNRAKLILIGSFGMTEAKAHRYIEKRAMEERKTKTEIAQNIIKSYGNQRSNCYD